MTTPTPTPEAVEAARIYVCELRQIGATDQFIKAVDYLTPLQIQADRTMLETSARILAAEVERLRAEIDRAEQKIEADRIARDHIIAQGVALEKELERRHAEYSKALNKRVDVEAQLIDIGAGKRELPTREECREWALKLGNS